MRIIILIFTLTSITIKLYCQYSLNGVIVTEDAKTHLNPLYGVRVELIGKNQQTKTDINGQFSFNDLDNGIYSLKLHVENINNTDPYFNKIIVNNIDLNSTKTLDTILLLLAYQIIDFHYLTNGNQTIASLKRLYSNNGSFILDTIGLKEKSLQDDSISSIDSVQYLLRHGKWIYGNHIVYYYHGKLNGKYYSYYDDSKLKLEGNLKNYIHNGVWKYYNEQGKLRFIIDFIDGYLVIDQKGFNIKDYNQNIYEIYSN